MSLWFSSNGDLATYFDKLGPYWDAMQSPERSAHLAHLLEPHAALFSGAQRVLDVGTGTGAFLPHLYRLAPEARVVAVDLSHVMLSLARANGRANGTWYWCADAQQLPIVSGQISLITCHDSFAHFEDRPAALHEFWRALVPGGRLLILHDISRDKLNAIHSQADCPRIRTHLLPPVDELAALVGDVGFTVLTAADAPDHYLITAQRA